ncbi:MAG: diaminopimelate epimerase, partial [Elusimicrobia bacterium]|nr:diaminopimelate epimerase [Elusimicrobiota bacterium]
MTRRFWKLSGAGNDFVLLEGPLRAGGALARRLCDRRNGIGADGLLVLEPRSRRLSYFNADGSRAFCGNGCRCAAVWLARRGYARTKTLELLTDRGRLSVRLLGARKAAVAMPRPRLLRAPLLLSAAGRRWPISLWDSGAPHAVARVADVEKAPVEEAGCALRLHRALGRAGANVDFVQVASNGLLVRTYERGVEAETPACGTGLLAAGAAAEAFGWAHLPLR